LESYIRKLKSYEVTLLIINADWSYLSYYRMMYDAVLCDYVMPEKSGLELLKELRENGNSIPFVMFTGKDRVATKALNLGADHYVNKIGNPETLYSQLAYSILDAVERKRESLKK